MHPLLTLLAAQLKQFEQESHVYPRFAGSTKTAERRASVDTVHQHVFVACGIQPPLGQHQADMAQAMTQQARQLSALVTNLLDMARLQNGSVNLRKDWQSSQEVIGSSIRAAQHALLGRVVQTDVSADLPLVEFDAVLMERVLVNLLENAAKYGAAPIVVKASVTPDKLVLSIRDHGPGLPAQMVGREAELFDKFTRGNAESATPGVGLGLAICKAVVEAHRGQISAANAVGGGAEFKVVLPRHAPPVLE